MRKSSGQAFGDATQDEVMPGNGDVSPVAASFTTQRSSLLSPAPSQSPQQVLRQQTEGSSQGQLLPLSDHIAMTAHRSSDPAPGTSGAVAGQSFDLSDGIRPVVPTSAPGVLALGVGSSDSGTMSPVQAPVTGSKLASAAAAFSRRGGRRRK